MSGPLRIAMFVGCFPVVSETFILRQITGLLDLGHGVDIFADTRSQGHEPAHPEVARYDLRRRTTWMDMPPESAPWELPIRPLTGRTWLPGAAEPVRNCRRLARVLPRLARCLTHAPRVSRQLLRTSDYGYRAASLSGIYRLAKLLDCKARYDVLHAHFGLTGESFRFARHLWQAPLVVSFHGYDFTTLPRTEGRGMYRRLFATADAVTANSDYTRARLEELGCPLTKLHRLPVGLDPDAFPFRERHWCAGEPVRLLTVARLVEIKGHEFMLRALARLRERPADVRYDIVGDGPLRDRLEKLTADLGLTASVTFWGALAGEALRQRMSAAHLAVLASVSVEGDQEGQGLFLQEAQACGLPVVATRHGALPEGLVPGRSGALVPEGDAEALAKELHSLIQHADHWPAMGRAGRTFVQAKYHIRNLNRRLVELYAAVIARFGDLRRKPAPGGA